MSILKSVLMVIIFYPLNLFAGEWIQVQGSANKLEINPENLEESLWEYIDNNADRSFKPKDTYTYQYKFINDSEIFINALCEYHEPQSLSENLIIVFDGGSCYFQTKYDFRTNKFYDFQVNGEA